MKSDFLSAPYEPAHRDACLALFDANCPGSFTPDEREEYVVFLEGMGEGYRVVLLQGNVMAAFGVYLRSAKRSVLRWIVVDAASQGNGIGRAIMQEAGELARAQGAAWLDIATSHLSEAFFTRQGARKIGYTEDGWGAGMHRVDMELPL